MSDKFDFIGDDERDPLSNGAIRDTYIRLERWSEAAALCEEMDAIRDTVLTGEGAVQLKKALLAHLTLEHDGAGWWNVVDVELAAPDIEGMLARSKWSEVAGAMVNGALVSVAIMRGWQAAMVAAYLPDELRLEREGHSWLARREFFAKVGVA